MSVMEDILRKLHHREAVLIMCPCIEVLTLPGCPWKRFSTRLNPGPEGCSLSLSGSASPQPEQWKP